MCGRYVRRASKQQIADYFRITRSVFDFPPSYNIAPTSFQPVVRLDRDTGERELVPMRFGLIPAWLKDAKRLGVSTINARAETLLEKPIWRGPFKKRRCLVPADAYYEWQHIDSKTRQPHAFALQDDSLFAFAGLWEQWLDPEGKPIDTFTLITTAPNPLAAAVHDRMPVILEPRDYTRWLTPTDEEPPPLDLLRPYDADRMKAWKVDPRVGNVRNNEPGLCGDWPEREKTIGRTEKAAEML